VLSLTEQCPEFVLSTDACLCLHRPTSQLILYLSPQSRSKPAMSHMGTRIKCEFPARSAT
jgi:hypothetical protein